MKARVEHLILAAACVAIVLGLVAFGGSGPGLTPDQDRERAGQTRSYSASGTSALYALLSRVGLKTSRWEKRYDLLKDDVKLLVIVKPRLEPDVLETNALLEWVGRGGSVILFPSAETKSFTAGLGWKFDARPRGGTTVTARLDREPYRMKIATDSRVSAERDAVALVEDELGWIVSRLKHGRGSIVIVSDPSVVSNTGIKQEENAAAVVRGIVWPLAAGGAVAFDEYHHGFDSEQGLFGYIMSTPAGTVAWHAIIAGFLLLMLGRRLGPPREVHEERRRRPLEFIEAFARLCRSRRARGLAASMIAAEVKESVRRRFGNAERETIVREAARRGLNGDALVWALDSASKSAGRPLSAKDLLRLAAALDDLKAMTR